jgi:uncharacterized protein (TIGR03437 family)
VVMKKILEKLAPIAVMVAISGALAPFNRAQDGAITRVGTTPEGLIFQVDGQITSQTLTALWPVGSMHRLDILAPQQTGTRARYTFQGWASSDAAIQNIAGNLIEITVKSTPQEVRAAFAVEYAVSVQCPALPAPYSCDGGSVAVEGLGTLPIGQDFYFPSDVTVNLTPTPASGYVFAGWQTAGPDSANRLVVKGPTTLYPVFRPVRSVTVNTAPEMKDLIIDRTPMTAPYTYTWGAETQHIVDAVSPQLDNAGQWWVFKSWSDGGAAQHAYVPPLSDSAQTLTATFVPAVTSRFLTNPSGLSLMVDGQKSGTPLGAMWAAGDKHRVEAPARQVDSHGRAWTFTGWSDGATAAVKDVTVPATEFQFTANYAPVGLLTLYTTLPGAAVTVDGAACAVPCEIQRPVGTEVRVGASASVQVTSSVRGDFSGWTGSASSAALQLVVTLNGDQQAVWANYRTMYRLSLASEPAGAAVWTVSPSSPDGFYETGTAVNVAVAAPRGYRFLRWEGDLSGIVPSGAVVMNDVRQVRAVLDAAAAPSPTVLVNGAGVTPEPVVASGSVVSVFGADLAASTVIGPTSPLSQTLGGVTARVEDRLAPLFFVSAGQINLQLPSDLADGAHTLVVSSAGRPDASADFTVARNAPGLFPYAVGDTMYALALHEDGSLITVDSPARRGELISLYGSGFGPSKTPRPEGLAVPDSPVIALADPVTVLIGDAFVVAESAVAAPGRASVDVVRFRTGSGTPAGVLPLRVRINNRESNTVQLPVR